VPLKEVLMMQWQHAPLPQLLRAIVMTEAVQEMPTKLTSMIVKIVRNACGTTLS
jgi:hypothetical protein